MTAPSSTGSGTDLSDDACCTPGTETPAAQRIFERLMEIARSSALEEMASGMAHELNQPLGAIATYANAGERMLNRPEPMVVAAGDVFKQISAAALNAGEGIRRIRRLFNRDTPQLHRCSVAELLAELRPLLELLARRAAGQLQLEIAAPLPDVYADSLRIQHVLFTLVNNAFEACMDNSSDNPPRVRIKIQHDDYSVLTTVSDSGCGISADAGEHIFRPFYTTKEQGTGLGLASSRAIIEAHDGSIGFDPIPEGGAAFWFRLPIMVEPAE